MYDVYDGDDPTINVEKQASLRSESERSLKPHLASCYQNVPLEEISNGDSQTAQSA